MTSGQVEAPSMHSQALWSAGLLLTGLLLNVPSGYYHLMAIILGLPLRGSSTRNFVTVKLRSFWVRLYQMQICDTNYFCSQAGSTADHASSNNVMNRALTRRLSRDYDITLSASDIQVGCGGHVFNLVSQYVICSVMEHRLTILQSYILSRWRNT